jgi:hypothetical protein
MARMNVVDITLGGTGMFVSVNYSRKHYIQRDFFLNVSAGAGSYPGIGGISLPHQLTLNYGKSMNYFEAGVGGSYWRGISFSSGIIDNISSYNISPVAGYRRDLYNDFVFRVYVNPLFYIAGDYLYQDKSVLPYAGISLGYSF